MCSKLLLQRWKPTVPSSLEMTPDLQEMITVPRSSVSVPAVIEDSTSLVSSTQTFDLSVASSPGSPQSNYRPCSFSSYSDEHLVYRLAQHRLTHISAAGSFLHASS